MTFSHGIDNIHNAIRMADASVHNLEHGMRGGFDYNAVYAEIGAFRQRDTFNGRFDGGLFRVQINEMDRRFHQDGYLPHLHIRLDEACNPLMVPDKGFGSIARSHSPYGPFHTGHYVHRSHHRPYLPPSFQINSDSVNGTAGNTVPYDVEADSPFSSGLGDSSPQTAPIGPVGDGSANAGNSGLAGGANAESSVSSSPFRLASYTSDQQAGGSLPQMDISDGGLPPGGVPDQNSGPVDQSLPSPNQSNQAIDQGGQSNSPVAQPTDQGGQASAPGGVPSDQSLSPQINAGSDQGQPPVAPSDRPTDAPATVPVATVPDAQLTMSGAPTITPQKIDEVLRAYHSPAAGMGQYVYDQGVKHGINPAMALAFYVVESQCGTKGLAVQNKSWGNVRGHGPHGYRPYDSIKDSLDHWYDMIVNLYQNKFHADKLAKVISHYAPNSDGNNESAYIRSVGQMVRKWQC